MPRYYSGFQYIGILIVFIELLPEFFQKLKNFFLSIFLFSSIPWLLLDLYYSYPLISKAFLKSEKFKKDYIPFYEDFLKLDRKLEINSQIIVIGTRINTFHSQRQTFHYRKKIVFPINEIKDKEKPTYLFVVGSPEEIRYELNKRKDQSLYLGQLVYSNRQSNHLCYSPNCTKKLNVYKIDNNKSFLKFIFEHP